MPQELHRPWGETCVRELAQAQEIQLSRGLQRARPSLPSGSFFWCAFAFQTALILRASPYLPAAVRQRSQEQPQGTNRPPPAAPTSLHLRDAARCVQLLLSLPAAPAGNGSPKQQLWHHPSCLLSPTLERESQQKSAKTFPGGEIQG